MRVLRRLVATAGLVLFLGIPGTATAQDTEVLYVNGQWVTVSNLGSGAQEVEIGDRRYSVVRSGDQVTIKQTWPPNPDANYRSVPAVRTRPATGFGGGSPWLEMLSGLSNEVRRREAGQQVDLLPHLEEAIDLIEDQRETIEGLRARNDSIWKENLRWQADAELIHRLNELVKLASSMSDRISRELERNPQNEDLRKIHEGLISMIVRASNVRENIIDGITSRPREDAIVQMGDEVMHEWEFSRWVKILENPDEWLPEEENPFLPREPQR